MGDISSVGTALPARVTILQRTTRNLRCFRYLLYCIMLVQIVVAKAQDVVAKASDSRRAGISGLDEMHAPAGLNFQVAPSSADDAALQNAAAMVKAGAFQNAESSLRSYLVAHENAAEAHYLLGYVLYREKKPKNSLAEYTHGAAVRSPSAGDLAAVSMDYVLLGAYTDADTWMTRAISMEPNDAVYWYYLGRIKYNENRFQESIDAFCRSLALRPLNVRAEYNLGLAYAGKALDDKAIAAYETAISWQNGRGHEDPQPYLDLGMLLTNKGQLQQAVPYLQTAVKLDGQNPKIHEEMGRVYEQLHDLGRAQIELETAVALAPNIPSLHFQLGRIYRKENMTERAKDEFARCTALNGTHSTDSLETPNPDMQP